MVVHSRIFDISISGVGGNDVSMAISAGWISKELLPRVRVRAGGRGGFVVPKGREGRLPRRRPLSEGVGGSSTRTEKAWTGRFDCATSFR